MHGPQTVSTSLGSRAFHFFLSMLEYLNVTECKSISYRPLLKVSIQIPDRKVKILEFCGFCTFIGLLKYPGGVES